MSHMKEIALQDLPVNPFEMIGKDWMLITAKKDNQVNTMTASWGGMGVIWHHNVVYVFIRQSRFTKEFVDAADGFSVSFYPADEKRTLSYLGTVSGRDEDKIAKAGYTTAFDGEIPYFEEAKTVLICKKLSKHFLGGDGMLDETIIPNWYSGSDEGNYHEMYIGKIEKVLVKED
ncbi:MAG: flavin reductase [Lachnospiraceae bacterium]|nr:flavin reductase [Lachnospiraceae bacterium]